MADKSSSRIAIKFGGPSSSTKPRKESRPEPTSALGKRRRTFGADSDDEDEEDPYTGHHEVISGFGEDGAEFEGVDKSKPVGPSESVKATSEQNQNPKRESPGESMDRPVQWGLNITKPSNTVENQSADRPREDPLKDQHLEEKTVDEEALDSLLGKSNQSSLKLIAKASQQTHSKGPGRPQADVSSLEDYDNIPVEGFGAALLRGMGWNGENRGAKIRDNKRRENHLGLGASKLKEAEDLGAWGQGKKRPRVSEYKRDEEKRKEARGERYRGRDDSRDGSDWQRSHRTWDSDQDRNRDRADRRDLSRDKDRKHDRDRERDREGDYRGHGRDRDRDRHDHRDRHSRR